MHSTAAAAALEQKKSWARLQRDKGDLAMSTAREVFARSALRGIPDCVGVLMDAVKTVIGSR